MNQYFAYIRVSTTRQGEQGVSLPQQRDAIERYAQHNKLQIGSWFEEQETAAKQGRPVFGQVMKLLRRHEAIGIIIHKIDRSARNLKDWADLGEMIDQGIEVHFANESLDMTSRGGRLSADIQAVVAADYIRNLREETKKGLYGRLKQGYFPMPAPLGYLDNGAARAKTPDPQTAPLVRKAFELYASGLYNLRTLGRELQNRGLRRRNGSAIPRNRLSDLLNNPFYYGLIHIKKTNQYFSGVHEPLVSKRLFDQVQAVLQGKTNTQAQKHDFLYRRRLSCSTCEYSLIGETHKGFVYYRCQTRQCPRTCVREEAVEEAVITELARLQFSLEERRFLQAELARACENAARQRDEAMTALNLRINQNEDRLSRLTDAYIDRLIDAELFESRKKALLAERRDLDNQLVEWRTNKRDPSAELAKFLERADTAYLAYKSGLITEKRELLDALTSNRVVDRKNPTIMLSLPFRMVADRTKFEDGCPRRDIARTWSILLPQLLSQLLHQLAPTTMSQRAA